MNLIQNIAMAAALACSASGAFAAQPAPFYGEALAGISTINQDCEAGLSCEDSDIGFRLGGGYRFDDTFGIAGGYMNLGKFTTKGTAQGISANGSFKSSGPYLAATFRTQVMPKLDVTASLGGYYGMNKASGTICVSGRGCTSNSAKDNKLKPYVGLDLSYELMRGLSVGGALDFTEIVDSGDSGGAVLFGAKVRYSF